jgi:predicted nucleotidyltransferase
MNPQVSMLETVAAGFGELVEKVVFVGGIVTVLYMDSPSASEPRPTEDVDCVVDALTYHEYGEFEQLVRKKGFLDDSSPGAPICRKVFKRIKVDIMPTKPEAIGFSNKWYPEGTRQRIRHDLPSGTSIYIFSLPYFIASKLEAFLSRGRIDPRQSSDLEDVILVLDASTDPSKDLDKLDEDVRLFVRGVIKDIRPDDFREVVAGCLGGEYRTDISGVLLSLALYAAE